MLAAREDALLDCADVAEARLQRIFGERGAWVMVEHPDGKLELIALPRLFRHPLRRLRATRLLRAHQSRFGSEFRRQRNWA